MFACAPLCVGMFGAEYLLRTIDCCLLNYVSPLAAAVVTLLRITLGILVCEDRAGSFEHGFADEILARNQLQPVSLARDFVVDGLRNHRINFSKRGVS
jgi:hypothetical protein